MKKIIGTLLFLKLLVLSYYAFVYLQNENFYELLLPGTSTIEVNFYEENDLEAFDYFLSLIETKDLHLTRTVFPNQASTHFYTTDFSLNGAVSLIEGRFPIDGTEEFISTVETEDINQVGVIADLVPGQTLIVSSISNPRNFVLDGGFSITTQDPLLLNEIIESLEPYVRDIAYWLPWQDGRSRWERIFASLNGQENRQVSGLEFVEASLIIPTLFLCVLTSLIQHTLKQLKPSAIYLMNGFSTRKIMWKLTQNIFSLLALTAFIAYLCKIALLYLTGHLVFLQTLTQIFMATTIFMIAISLFLTNVITYFTLKSMSLTKILKGKKIDHGVQVINHVFKGTFMIIFIFFFSMAIHNLGRVNHQLNLLSHWEIAQNVHRPTISLFGADLGEVWTRFEGQKRNFYIDLVENGNGFAIDSGFISDNDAWLYNPWLEANPLDRIDRLYISPSYLKINPIYSLEGNLAYDQIIHDDYVLNLLLPYRLIAYQQQIEDIYLSEFYNWWSLELHGSRSEKEKKINTIIVGNDQSYFTFNEFARPQDGNIVTDPLAIIYNGRFAKTWLSYLVSHSLFFIAETTNPFGEIQPFIENHGLENSIRRIESLYDPHVRDLQALQTHQTRLKAILFLLGIVNFSVAYNLIGNYFERHKFSIFLKFTFGWNFFKQNQSLFFTYLSYTLPLIVIMSFALDWNALLIGFIVLILDSIAILYLNQKLLKKSFSEIMKGER